MTLNQLSKYTLRALTLQKCSLWEVLHMFKLIVYSHGRVSGSVCYLTMDFFSFFHTRLLCDGTHQGLHCCDALSEREIRPLDTVSHRLWTVGWTVRFTDKQSIMGISEKDRIGKREVEFGSWPEKKGGKGDRGRRRGRGAVSMLADVEKSLWTKTWFTLGW